MAFKISDAETAYKNKNYRKAAAIYRQLTLQEPENVNALEGFALSLYRLKKNNQAAETAQKILEREPDSFIAHQVKSYIYARKRKFEQSESEIRKAYELNSNSSEILAFFGGLLILKKDKEGIPMLQEAIRLNNGEWLAHYNLGLAKSAQGALNEAVHEFVIAYRLHPSLRTGLTILDSYIYKQRLWAFFVLLSIFAFSFILHSLILMMLLVGVSYSVGIRFLFERRWGESLLIIICGTGLLILGKYIFIR
jgi:tetratricopeptide (TPR) repeat protein